MTEFTLDEHNFVTGITPEVSGPISGYYLDGERINRNSRHFGIYDRYGKAISDTDIVSGQLTTVPEENVTLPDSIDRISKPTFFAGLVMEQYGHVLINSIGRLWALSNIPEDTTLIFLPKRQPRRNLYPHLSPVLKLLNIKNDFIISKGPLFLENIYTATDIFGERFSGYGTENFFKWIDEKFDFNNLESKSRKIYVTRSKLGANYGRFTCEDHLERLLQKCGYEIFAPEQYSLTEQAKAFHSAEKLIFSEGSALHLYALLGRPSQQVAVIQRRKQLPELIHNQLFSRPGPSVSIIDAIGEIYWPPLRSDHLSVSMMNFDVLRERLLTSDFIDREDAWSVPSKELQEQSLRMGLKDGEEMLNAPQRKKFLSELKRNRKN